MIKLEGNYENNGQNEKKMWTKFVLKCFIILTWELVVKF